MKEFIFTMALVIISAITLPGCAPQDDFADYSVTEYPPIEHMSAETEFAEYDGNTETIQVFLTNDSDEAFHFDYSWQLEKEADGEWRAIRFINERRGYPVNRFFYRGTLPIKCNLKELVKLPLLPGRYRLWVGGSEGRVSAEFAII